MNKRFFYIIILLVISVLFIPLNVFGEQVNDNANHDLDGNGDRYFFNSYSTPSSEPYNWDVDKVENVWNSFEYGAEIFTSKWSSIVHDSSWPEYKQYFAFADEGCSGCEVYYNGTYHHYPLAYEETLVIDVYERFLYYEEGRFHSVLPIISDVAGGTFAKDEIQIRDYYYMYKDDRYSDITNSSMTTSGSTTTVESESNTTVGSESTITVEKNAYRDFSKVMNEIPSNFKNSIKLPVNLPFNVSKVNSVADLENYGDKIDTFEVVWRCLSI